MSAFSWIDYDFNLKNNETNDIKILKRSDLSQNDSKKKITSKMKISNKTEEKRTPCRILDLNVEERAKIAKLVKEFAKIEMEKKNIFEELKTVKNNFQEKLQGFESNKLKLEQEKEKLQHKIKEQENKILQLESCHNDETVPKFITKSSLSDEFILFPSNGVNHSKIVDIHDQPIVDFVGPPKSQNSREILLNLSRGNSRQNLIEEHSKLIQEKSMLELLIKQQKCLKQLQRRYKRLENLQQAKQSINQSRDTVDGKILNDKLELEETLQYQTSAVVNEEMYQPEIVPEKLPNTFDDEDLIIINALSANKSCPLAQKSSKQLSPCTSSSYSVLGSSPTDSLVRLLDVIDNQEDPSLSCTPVNKPYNLCVSSSSAHSGSSNLDSVSSFNLSAVNTPSSHSNCNYEADNDDYDIISDLFFHIK